METQIDPRVLDQKLEALMSTPGGWNKIAQQINWKIVS